MYETVGSVERLQSIPWPEGRIVLEYDDDDTEPCLVSYDWLVTDHPVQAEDKSLIGDQPWEPIKQVLFGEGVDYLDPRVTLLTPDKQENRQNFLVGELMFRIIAVSLAVAIQSLLVL